MSGQTGGGTSMSAEQGGIATGDAVATTIGRTGEAVFQEGSPMAASMFASLAIMGTMLRVAENNGLVPDPNKPKDLGAKDPSAPMDVGALLSAVMGPELQAIGHAGSAFAGNILDALARDGMHSTFEAGMPGAAPMQIAANTAPAGAAPASTTPATTTTKYRGPTGMG